MPTTLNKTAATPSLRVSDETMKLQTVLSDIQEVTWQQMSERIPYFLPLTRFIPVPGSTSKANDYAAKITM